MEVHQVHDVFYVDIFQVQVDKVITVGGSAAVNLQVLAIITDNGKVCNPQVIFAVGYLRGTYCPDGVVDDEF